MKNYYHLTKKQLSFISSEEAPVSSCLWPFKRLSHPVVVVSSMLTGKVIHVYSLKWFKHIVAEGRVYPNTYIYQIKAMF